MPNNVSVNKSMALFADLRTGSSLAEVDAAVAKVVEALVASVKAASDMRAARRDVANLLDYLHALKTSRHPGRVQLATALGERILPLLYEPEPAETAVKDDYPFLEEEAAVVERGAEIMGDVITFLCARDRQHPRRGKQVRDDGIPPLFLFAPEFREGFRRLLSVLVRSYMRNKHSETAVYKQVRDVLSGKTVGDVSRYDRQINNLVRTALDRAQEHHGKARAAAEQSQAESQSMGTAGEGNSATPEVSPEQEAARDAFETAHLHAQDAGYFLPYSLDFEILAQIYTLDRKLIAQGLVALGHAVVQAETENYVIRQIDRLNDTHDLVHFDVTVLSAFLYGNKVERISYKQMHDACLGAAPSRAVMLRMRPLLVAELARRPHQLARRLVTLSEDKSVGREDYEAHADLFTRWLASLNGRRFEDEISGCITLIEGNQILKPVVDWIYSSRRDPDLAPMAINDVSIRRDEIFRR
ncbi:hypothetical protein [Hwanghaeella sp.]|uniref:hypothetical protein n=1 Tax=Hwanghaeella sp. TaxID=2605943 RepID=UPI003CCB7510